jgi:hypothetical protein
LPHVSRQDTAIHEKAPQKGGALRSRRDHFEVVVVVVSRFVAVPAGVSTEVFDWVVVDSLVVGGAEDDVVSDDVEAGGVTTVVLEDDDGGVFAAVLEGGSFTTVVEEVVEGRSQPARAATAAATTTTGMSRFMRLSPWGKGTSLGQRERP